MHLTALRGFVVLLIAIIPSISCGGGKASSEAGDFPEPPSSLQRLGLGEPTEPARWLQATGDSGATILVYEDVVGYENTGTPQEIVIRAELEITEHPQTHELTYRWRERHFHRERDEAPKVVKTFDADGAATRETIAGKKGDYSGREGPLTVYRLQSTTLPESYRTWVLFGNKLVVPTPRIEESGPIGTAVLHMGRATPHALEVTQYPDEFVGWKLRLRRGDELTVRLDRPTASPAAQVAAGSNGAQLTLVETTSQPAFESTETTDVYRFKAAAPGWADLTFNKMTSPTFRVRVE